MSVWRFKIYIFSVHDNVGFNFILTTAGASCYRAARSVKESHCNVMFFSGFTIISHYKFSLTAFFIGRSGK